MLPYMQHKKAINDILLLVYSYFPTIIHLILESVLNVPSKFLPKICILFKFNNLIPIAKQTFPVSLEAIL